MFSLDEKPVFYNYPLSKPQQSYLNERLDQLKRQMASIRIELSQIQQQTSRKKYQQYRQRLRGKMAILNEQILENQRILDIHATIEKQVRRNHQNHSQVKAKLLDHYKAAIMAKQSRKMIDELKDKQLQKKLLFGDEIPIDQQMKIGHLQHQKYKKENYTKGENSDLRKKDISNRDLFFPPIFSSRAKNTENGLYYYSNHLHNSKDQRSLQSKRKVQSCIVPIH